MQWRVTIKYKNCISPFIKKIERKRIRKIDRDNKKQRNRSQNTENELPSQTLNSNKASPKRARKTRILLSF